MVTYAALLLTLLLTCSNAIGQAQQYERTATTKGLIAWWAARPNFTGGTFLYDIAGRFHATLTNMGTAGTTSGWATPTRLGSAGELRFDGSNDFAVTASSSRLYPAEFTLTAWANVNVGSRDYQLIMGVPTGDTRELWVRNNGHLTYQFQGTNYGYGHEGSIVIPTNTWTHLAWSYSAVSGGSGSGQLYVNCAFDGGPDTGGGAGNPFPATNVVIMGARSATQDMLTGALDDLRVYNRVLSQLEVCQVMKYTFSPKAMFERKATSESLVAFILGKFGSFFPFFRPQQ